MKKIVLFAAFVAVIFLIGCTGPGTDNKGNNTARDSGKSGKTVVTEAMDKQETITGIQAEYSSTTQMLGVSIPATIKIYKSGSSQRTDSSSTYLGQTAESRTYVVNNKISSCTKQLGTWSCATAGSTAASDPASQRESFNRWIDNGAITFGTVTAKTIAGRTCDEVAMTIDVSKLGQEDLGLTNPASISRYAITECFDRETGLGLSMSLDMAMSGGTGGTSASISMTLEATSVQTGQSIPASTFELPAAATDYGAGAGTGYGTD